MGNRCVIVSHDVTKENQSQKIGIYLHWCGSQSSVKKYLEIAKSRQIRGVDQDDQYCWARLVQIICDEFSADGDNQLSVGVDIVSKLDTNNGDNGVYYINDNFEIVKHTDGSELN